MTQIVSTQIKAARAYLSWSQEELAQNAGLSVATIRNLEFGHISHRSLLRIRHVIEAAGIEFTEQEGVRLRADDVRIINGPDSTDVFFDDLIQTLKTKGGELLAVMQSQDTLFDSLGASLKNKSDHLNKIAHYSSVRFLAPDFLEPRLILPRLESRIISHHYIGPVPYFIYGDKHAVVMKDRDNRSLKYIVFHSMDLSLSYREHFFDLWNIAATLRQSPRSNSVI